MGNSARHFSRSSMNRDSSVWIAGMSLPPSKVAQGDKEEPRKAGSQRNAEPWHPPSGNEDKGEGCGTENRAPGPARTEAHRWMRRSNGAPPKHQMCEEDHQPYKNSSEKRGAEHIDICRPAVAPLQKQRGDHADAGCEQGGYGSAAFTQPPQGGRSIASARQRKQHARGEIQIAVHAGQSRRQHHEIHHTGGRANTGRFENSNEGAL